jgi:hypothetical protein
LLSHHTILASAPIMGLGRSSQAANTRSRSDFGLADFPRHQLAHGQKQRQGSRLVPASRTHTQQSSTDTPITPERNRRATLPRLPRTLLSYCYTTSEARPPISAAHCAANSAIHIYMAFLPDIIIYTKTDTPKRLARPNPSSTRPIAKNAFIRVLRGYTGQESLFLPMPDRTWAAGRGQPDP